MESVFPHIFIYLGIILFLTGALLFYIIQFLKDVRQLKRIKKKPGEFYFTLSENEKKFLEHEISVLEAERNRIAQDLHDGLAQDLTGLKWNLELIKLEPNLSEQGHSALLRMNIQVDRIFASIKTVIWNLSPFTSEPKGLNDMIHELCTLTNSLRIAHIDFVSVGTAVPLEITQELALFRIVQEAINNSIKHSLTWNIDVFVMWHDNELIIKIVDEGIGRDKARTYRNQNDLGGKGLGNLKRRAMMINATLTIEDHQPKGTAVIIHMPTGRNIN